MGKVCESRVCELFAPTHFVRSFALSRRDAMHLVSTNTLKISAESLFDHSFKASDENKKVFFTSKEKLLANALRLFDQNGHSRAKIFDFFGGIRLDFKGFAVKIALGFGGCPSGKVRHYGDVPYLQFYFLVI